MVCLVAVDNVQRESQGFVIRQMQGTAAHKALPLCVSLCTPCTLAPFHTPHHPHYPSFVSRQAVLLPFLVDIDRVGPEGAAALRR